jgi:hypothetical protein
VVYVIDDDESVMIGETFAVSAVSLPREGTNVQRFDR